MEDLQYCPLNINQCFDQQIQLTHARPKHALHAPSKIFANVVKWTVIAILTSPIYSIILFVLPGAHNDVGAEGKGRSVQRPHKILKFENVLTVVPPLLFLACSERVQTREWRLHKE